MIANCVVCGKQFHKTGTQIICSYQCKMQRVRPQWRKANNKRYQKIAADKYLAAWATAIPSCETQSATSDPTAPQSPAAT